jgi:hypothetical protein
MVLPMLVPTGCIPGTGLMTSETRRFAGIRMWERWLVPGRCRCSSEDPGLLWVLLTGRISC